MKSGRQVSPDRNRPLVCILDDDPSVRRQLRRRLNHEGYDTEVFESSASFFRFSSPYRRPTCILLDIRMPGVSGVEVYQELKRRGSATPVIFLTGYGQVSVATRVMKDGAVDFLEKPVSTAALLSAVRDALNRSESALAEAARLDGLAGRYESLTPREREVMDHVVAGRLNKQTAFDLGVTEGTIKVHRARVMKKMGADSLSDLTLMALGLGRVAPHANRRQPAESDYPA